MRHFSPANGLKSAINKTRSVINPESPIKKIQPSERSRKVSSPASPS